MKMHAKRVAVFAAVVATALSVPVAIGQGKDPMAEGIAKYREALQSGANPAELWEARGEGIWKTAAGPNKATLEKCDLGLGPGVVKGAYAQMPRYFPDADSVMDLETRLVWCRVKLQGLSDADAKKNHFGGRGKKSDNEALVAYVTSESRGIPMNVTVNHPKEAEAFALGEKIFFFRGGPYDFACSTCHGESNKRIRLQDLPNLNEKKGAQLAYSTWPAYRVSQGELRTFQWRLNDCFRQQRFPELQFASDASVALTMFLARNANGAQFDAPAIKR